jgi:hypothetical protein
MLPSAMTRPQTMFSEPSTGWKRLDIQLSGACARELDQGYRLRLRNRSRKTENERREERAGRSCHPPWIVPLFIVFPVALWLLLWGRFEANLSRRDRVANQGGPSERTATGLRKCPYCAEEVKAEVLSEVVDCQDEKSGVSLG